MHLGLHMGLSRRGGPSGPSYGPELIVNGDGSSTTGWLAESGAVHTIVGGRHRVTVDGAGTAGALIKQDETLDVGATYRVQATIWAQVANTARVSFAGSTVGAGSYHVMGTGPTTVDVTFTAGAFVEIYLAVVSTFEWGAANTYAEFDDISLKKVL